MTNNNNNHHNTTSEMSIGQKMGLGAGAIAVAAASYFLFGPKGKKHRDQAKGWMIKAKGEIVEKLEDAKEMSEPLYHSVVDSVIIPYVGRGSITREEVESFGRTLKDQWKQISSPEKPKKISTKKISKSKSK